jgi:hypothetical protein
MTDLSWVADENGVALHMPDPTGLTLGVTVTLPPEQVEAIWVTMRSAQLGADTTGDL